MTSDSYGRRDFLRHSAAAAGSAALAGTLHRFLERAAHGESRGSAPDYGPLKPTKDQATGLPLLQLPEAFRYVSFGWTGDALSDGTPTPSHHDGMAVIAADGDRLTLCRNHEITPSGEPFGPAAITYDNRGRGGCTNLVFDSAAGRWLESRASLSGTCRNCAGGPTPWGSWLSCEETLLGPDTADAPDEDFERTHGWIFEVPADEPANPVPLKDMGRFVHEAIAVDPESGYVYETEDSGRAGFYRFIPNEKGRLAQGGRLQMLKVPGRKDLRAGCRTGQTFDTEWVDIHDPQRAGGAYRQGRKQGAATFTRLEGCWYGNGLVYFDSTSGGDSGSGQIWQYDPQSEKLKLLFESPDKKVLKSPDNLAVSPRGGLVLCEDSDILPERLHGMTTDGRLFTLAVNNIVLDGERNGFQGDFRDVEWAGATFSPDGRWLFVNVQRPGITFAITGPWENGAL